MLEGDQVPNLQKNAVFAYTKILNQITNSLQVYSDKLKFEIEEATKVEDKLLLVG